MALIDDSESDWARISTKTYDFRKLTNARLLADNDDRVSGLSRSADDEEASEMLLDGPGWSVHRCTNLDPSEPVYVQEIEDSWSIVILRQEDRTAVAHAVETVRAACFLLR